MDVKVTFERWNTILSSLLRLLLLVFVITVLIGIEIPFISGYTAAFQMLGVLLLIKVGLKILQEKKARHFSS